MKLLLLRYLSALALAVPIPAVFAAPPSTESVETLLTLTQAQKNLDRSFDQLAVAMRAGVLNAMQGRPLSPAQESAVANFTANYIKSVKEEYGWAFLKPTIVQIYRETFTDEEVNGQIAFYRTPAGEAVVNKTPIVLQKSMAATQSRANTLMPKINEAMRTLMQELQTIK